MFRPDIAQRSPRCVPAAITFLLVITVSCGMPTQIPPGAQAVEVSMVGDQLHLEPSAVQAGDVYAILDESVSGISFRYRTIDGDPGDPPLPVTDDDIRSVEEQGSFMGEMSVGLSAGGYGNVFKLGNLVEGKYVMTAEPNSLAILEVVPPTAP